MSKPTVSYGFWKKEIKRILDPTQPDNLSLEYEFVGEADTTHTYTKHLKCGVISKSCNSTFVKKRGTCSNWDCKFEKQKQTNIEKYGTETVFQSEYFREESKKYFETTYGEGITNAQHVPEIRDKTEQTCMGRYGFKTSALNLEVIKKREETCVNRYGATHPAKSEIVQKHLSDGLRKSFAEGISKPHGGSWGTKIKLINYDDVYKSKWEAIFQLLNPSFLYEKIRIPYLNENKKSSTYIVDFWNPISKELIEIKPSFQLHTCRFKIQAAKEWSICNKAIFKVLSEDWYDSIINKDEMLMNQIEYMLRKK